MTSKQVTPKATNITESGRRKFLALFGSAALSSSAIIFGRPNAAHASYDVGCCHLSYKPDMSLSTCKSHSGNYTWTCRYSTETFCSCCEWSSHSAYSCTHTAPVP